MAKIDLNILEFCQKPPKSKTHVLSVLTCYLGGVPRCLGRLGLRRLETAVEVVR